MRWLLTVSSLRCMGDRLCQLTANDSLTICITLLPSQKLLFLLRTSPCFPFFRTSQSCAQSLAQYWILGLNPATQHGFKCHCLWDVMVWASGELPSCFLSSAYVTMELAQNLLPDHLKPCHMHMKQCANGLGEGSLFHLRRWDVKQRAWDRPQVLSTLDHIKDCALDNRTRASILAVSTPESWGNAMHRCISLAFIALAVHNGKPDIFDTMPSMTC